MVLSRISPQLAAFRNLSYTAIYREQGHKDSNLVMHAVAGEKNQIHAGVLGLEPRTTLLERVMMPVSPHPHAYLGTPWLS